MRTIDQRESAGQDASAVASKTSKQTMWFLVGRWHGDDHIRHVPIHSSPFFVGRRTGISLTLPNHSVSNLHAEIIDDVASLIVRDLGSTNGTYVNGQRISDPQPLKVDDLVQFGDTAFRLLRHSLSGDTKTVQHEVDDEALALVHFDKLMNERAVSPHYQPIVELAGEEIIGYEVLARSWITGLEQPAAMFSAAAKLNLEARLSEMIRSKSFLETAPLQEPPHLFVNTHPAELQVDRLVESMQEIRKLTPHQQITLEVHEAAVCDPAAIKELQGSLSELEIQLAFDDFGLGQARLRELTEVRPSCVKFDMSLIRNIHQASKKQHRMVRGLVEMVRNLKIVSLAEGIETRE